MACSQRFLPVSFPKPRPEVLNREPSPEVGKSRPATWSSIWFPGRPLPPWDSQHTERTIPDHTSNTDYTKRPGIGQDSRVVRVGNMYIQCVPSHIPIHNTVRQRELLKRLPRARFSLLASANGREGGTHFHRETVACAFCFFGHLTALMAMRFSRHNRYDRYRRACGSCTRVRISRGS